MTWFTFNADPAPITCTHIVNPIRSKGCFITLTQKRSHSTPWTLFLSIYRSSNNPLSSSRALISKPPTRVSCCSWTLRNICTSLATIPALNRALTPRPSTHIANLLGTFYRCSATSPPRVRKWTLCNSSTFLSPCLLSLFLEIRTKTVRFRAVLVWVGFGKTSLSP